MKNIRDDDFKEFSMGFYARYVEKTSLSINDLYRSGNPWHIYVAVLLSCENGDFSALKRLVDLLKNNDVYLLWQAASNLAGFAGSWNFISWLISEFEGEISQPGVKYFLSIILGASCNLQAVQPLLQLHSISDNKNDRLQIESELSYILEECDGEIKWGANETIVVDDEEDEENLTIVNRRKYFAVVDEHLQRLLRITSNGEIPVFEGRIYDVMEIAERIHKRLTHEPVDDGRLFRERLAFEAATGVDCTSFYTEDGTPARLTAVSIIESFLDGDGAARFIPGQRKFFSRSIVD